MTQTTNPFLMVDFPLEEGETIQRRVRQLYLDTQDKRRGPVDFSKIPEMLKVIAPVVPQHELADLAARHLREAQNEQLSLEARTHHFDLAGSKVWSLFTLHNNKVTACAVFIGMFVDANGY